MRVAVEADCIRSLRLALASFERAEVGHYPSPLHRLGGEQSLWCKDDSALSPVYGGNKVRKLEYLLVEYRRRGRDTLVCWGDEASHTVAAVARIAARCGFHVVSVVYPPGTESERRELPGTVVRAGGFVTAFLAARLRAMAPRTAYVPLGATTALSTLSHVHAALELVEQCGRERIDMPDRIYVAMGSGGTAVGLAIGLALAGVRTRVHGVRTVEAPVLTRRGLTRLATSALRALGVRKAEAPAIMAHQLCIDDRFLGHGYGDVTPDSCAAVAHARQWGLTLEPVHTGKAMAAMLADRVDGAAGQLLFWNTHDAQHEVHP